MAKKSNLKQVLSRKFNDKLYRSAYVKKTSQLNIIFQVKALRKQRGLSQADLGKLIGKSRQTISRLEAADNENFSIELLLDIATALDIALLVKFITIPEHFSQTEDIYKSKQVKSF